MNNRILLKNSLKIFHPISNPQTDLKFIDLRYHQSEMNQ